MKKYIWRTAAVMMASAALLVSCVELEENQTEAVGYLVAPSLEIDVTVDDLLLTKALDFKVETPSEDMVYFVVKDKNQDVRYEGEGLWTAPLLLPAGSYTVEASYGENGFGAPYFYEKVTGTIDNQEYENLGTINVPLENSLVRVSVSDELKTHFTPTSVSFNDGEHTASCGDWVYVPSDVILKLAVSGSNEAGISAVYIHTFGSKTTPKMAYDVVCGTTDSNWPEITMQEISSANAWASRIYITGSPDFTGEISQANMDKVIYEAIPADSDNWDSLAGASEVGSPVIKGLTPGTKYKVRARVGGLISKNSVEVTPTTDGLSVSAYHTTNAAGELDGTDVETVFSKSADVKEAITKWTISLYQKTGESEALLRSWSSLDKSDGSTITDEKGWPYLPTGNGESYVIKASAEMDGQTYDFNDISVTGLSAPDFSLTLSAYTSYDKYAGTNSITSNVDEANSCDAATLYKAGAKWGISVNLMKNTNYAKTLIVNIDGNTDRTFNVKGDYQSNEYYEDISKLAWLTHTLIVSVTFDKKTVSKTQTHHITGLPYTKDFTTDSSADGWAFDGKNNYDNSYSRDYKSGNGYIMYYAYTEDFGCNVFSPAFHFPQNETVNVAYQAAFNAGTTLHKNKSYTVYAGVTTGTTLAQTVSTSITEGTYSKYNTAQISSESALSDNYRFCFSHNADLSWGQGSQHYLYFGSLTVKYK